MDTELQQLVDRFHALERGNALFGIRVKGHAIWEYMRYYVFESINRTKSGVVFPRNKTSYAKKLLELMQYVVYRLNLVAFRPRSYDVLLYSHNKTAPIDGRLVYFHVYPVAKALSGKLRIGIVHQHDLPITRRDYPCPVHVTRPLYLYSRVRSYFIRYSSEDQAIFRRIGDLVNREFGTNIDMLALVKYIYSWHLVCYREHRRFFEKVRPRAIVFCDCGDTKPLIEAAHELGIKVVDYQHGIISPISMLYRYPDGFRDEELLRTNIDYFFSFGDYWHRFINTPAQAVSVGFPYFELCRGQKLAARKGGRGIVIASVLSARKTLARLAVELAEIMPDHTVFYKLRVDEYGSWRDEYPEDFKSKANIVVEDGSGDSLYDLYEKCDYLVSTNSMTLYEGLAHGLAAFVLKDGWYEEVRDLYENKHAHLVSSAREIAEIIQSGRAHESSVSPDLFFKRDSIRNVETALRDIVGVGGA